MPSWIYKRDGRLVPFEADKISRALFAVTESLNRPDAFLARELTDGIVHFLATELEAAIPTTTQVAELTAKVVRELGQPALAQAYADFTKPRVGSQEQMPSATEFTLRFSASETPASLVRTCLRNYSLQAVFTRDIVAAQRDGLLTLTGLDAPLELAGCVLPPTAHADDPAAGPTLTECIHDARTIAGGFVAVDGPEFGLVQRANPIDSARRYVRDLAVGLRAAGLGAIINLNSATPPAWAEELAHGPLFGDHSSRTDLGELSVFTDSLLDELLATAEKYPAQLPIRVDWYLSDRDFLPDGQARLLRVARSILNDASIAFVFEKPRRPVPIAEGIDRRCSAVLLTVGLQLPCLAQQVLATVPQPQLIAAAVADLTKTFLHKLASLTRMALSAAVQKRDFLRTHSADRPTLTSGFMLDRARLVVAPVGLDSTVRAFLGQGICSGGSAREFASQIVKCLRDVLREDGGRCQMDTALDSAAAYRLPRFTDQDFGRMCAWPAWSATGGNQIPDEEVAGLTPWDTAANIKSQIRSAGTLHAAADSGTATILLPSDSPITPEEIANWLHLAWQQGDIVRLRFLRISSRGQQLPLL